MTTTHRRTLGAGIAATAVTAFIASTPPSRGPRPPRATPTSRPCSCCRSTTTTATSRPPTRRFSRTLDPTPDPGRRRRVPRHHADASCAQGARRHTSPSAAGDLIGGSTFLSGLFHDEPSVESLNAMGLDVSSVGNHEFDEGTAELLRMQNGGCHPVDGCYFPDAAPTPAPTSTTSPRTSSRRTAPASRSCPARRVKTVDGVKVGFIGMTLEATPTLVNPAGVATSTSRTRSRPPTPRPAAQEAGREVDRRAAARGWLQRRHLQRSASASPTRSHDRDAR